MPARPGGGCADHTVYTHFRASLIEARLLEQLFAGLDRQRDAAGLILKRGAMRDATLIAAVSAPPKGERPCVDPDARFAKRKGKPGSSSISGSMKARG